MSRWSRALVSGDLILWSPIYQQIIIIITILTKIIITSVSMKQSKGLIQWSSNLPANPPPASVPPLVCARDRNRHVKVGKCKTSSGTLVFWRGLNDHRLKNVLNPRLTLVAAEAFGSQEKIKNEFTIQWSAGAEVLKSSTMATISLFMEVAKGILLERCIAWTASTSFAAEGQSYTRRSQNLDR